MAPGGRRLRAAGTAILRSPAVMLQRVPADVPRVQESGDGKWQKPRGSGSLAVGFERKRWQIAVGKQRALEVSRMQQQVAVGEGWQMS